MGNKTVHKKKGTKKDPTKGMMKDHTKKYRNRFTKKVQILAYGHAKMRFFPHKWLTGDG